MTNTKEGPERTCTFLGPPESSGTLGNPGRAFLASLTHRGLPTALRRVHDDTEDMERQRGDTNRDGDHQALCQRAGVCGRNGINGAAYYKWNGHALGGMKVGLQYKEGSAETALCHQNARPPGLPRGARRRGETEGGVSRRR